MMHAVLISPHALSPCLYKSHPVKPATSSLFPGKQLLRHTEGKKEGGDEVIALKRRKLSFGRPEIVDSIERRTQLQLSGLLLLVLLPLPKRDLVLLLVAPPKMKPCDVYR